MKTPKYILALVFTVTSSFALAGPAPVSTASATPTSLSPAPVPQLWTDMVCQNLSREACVVAHGWAWARRYRAVIYAGATTASASSATWVIGSVMRAAAGETPTVVYVMTASKLGIQTGMIMIMGGLIAAVIGTVFSAGSFLLSMTTSTGRSGTG